MSFWGELKRRKVVQVATVYAVVAWLLVQIVATVGTPLNLPSWFPTVVITLLAIGFPIALILAWAFDIGPAGVSVTESGARGPARTPGLFVYLSQALILLAVGYLIVNQYRPETPAALARAMTGPSSTTVNRFALTITEDQPEGRSRWPVFAFSPTGRRFVYQSGGGLYVRDFDTLGTRLVAGSESVLGNPFLSPDGRFVAYWSNGGDLMRQPLDGGVPAVIATGVRGINGANWSDDGTIYFIVDDSSVYRVSADGGEAELLIPGDRRIERGSPVLLPDGDSLMFSYTPTGNWDDGQTIVQSLTTGERRTLLQNGIDARYVEPGYLVYSIGDSLFGAPFDPEVLEVSGSPVELVTGVSRPVALSGANFGIARDGTLAYLGRRAERRRALVWVDRNGVEEAIDAMPGDYLYAKLSPDDSEVALNGWEGGERYVWIEDLVRGTRRRLTFDSIFNGVATWTPDGRVVYSRQDEFVSQLANGSGTPTVLYTGAEEGGRIVSDITPDGKTILGMDASPPRSTYAVPIGETTAGRVPLLDSPFSEYNATVSQDGHWLAYQSDETGTLQVFVRRYPDVDAGGKWQVSTDGGLQPVWSRGDARLELYYLEPKTGAPGIFKLMSVPVRGDSTESFDYDLPVLLFERRFFANFATFANPYDVSLDGSRFLTLKDAPLEDATSGTSEIVIVQNWVEELKRRVPID